MGYNQERTQTLDQIRGFAALLVVISHYGIFFFTTQDFCAFLCHTTPIDFSAFGPYINFFTQISFDLGTFAVALFFLLSGFFMPALLNRYPTSKAFLLNRFWRLIPTFIVALGINLIFLVSFAYYNKGEIPYTLPHVLSIVTLTRDIFGYPFIDGVIWTLEIEWKFCFFVAFFAPLIKRGDLKTIFTWQNIFFAVSLVIYLFLRNNEILTFPFLRSLAWSTALNLHYFTFMFIGALFYFIQENKIDKKQGRQLIAALSVIFFTQCFWMFHEAGFWKYVTSHTPALLLFAFVCTRHRPRSTTPGARLMDFITAISYPLYLVHAMPGYVVMYAFYNNGWNLFFGIGCGVLLSFLNAIWVHYLVELPSHNKAKSYRESTRGSPEKA